MTELYTIRNVSQRDKLIDQLKDKRPPFKLLVQDMNTVRSVDLNSYYFGVCVKKISDETGHNVDEIHEYLANKFRIEYYFDFRVKQMVFARTSTTQDDIREFWDYIEKVCEWAWSFLRVQIPHPNELIHDDKVNEITL